MKEKKLQVFVSSTYTDLIEERQAAVEAILSSGNIPAGMELFTAGDESQMAVIERWIDESDVYLLILGGRYGSIEPKTGKSYTHLEYEYAVRTNKPFFSVVINDDALEKKIQTNGSNVMEKENPKELRLFKQQVCQVMVEFWSDKKDIKLAIFNKLSEFAYRKDLVGWVRGNNVDTGVLAQQITELLTEKKQLMNQLASLNNSSEILYAGLTFDELKRIMESETFERQKDEVEFESTTLFDFFLNHGRKLHVSVNSLSSERIYRSLHNLMLVESYDNQFYQFTDDGQRFYIKCRALGYCDKHFAKDFM